MGYHPVQRILGSLLMAFSFFMLPPLFVSYLAGLQVTEDPLSFYFLDIFGEKMAHMRRGKRSANGGDRLYLFQFSSGTNDGSSPQGMAD